MTPEEIRVELAQALPPAVLLLGSVLESRSTAIRLMEDHKVHRADRVYIARLTAEYSRDIVAFAGASAFGEFKVIAACLEGASEQAQNILLKTLEEPPDSLRFILYAVSEPLPAVVSRCQVIRVSTEETAAELPGTAQGKVAAAVRAAQTGDPSLLAGVLRGWDDDCQVALRAWALGEAALSADRARPAIRVLEVLSRYPRARAVNAAAAALSLAYSEET